MHVMWNELWLGADDYQIQPKLQPRYQRDSLSGTKVNPLM